MPPILRPQVGGARQVEANGATLGEALEDLFTQYPGVKEQIVVPPTTLIIEPPAAVTSKSENPKTAAAFNQFLYTPAAQKLWGQAFYRPVDIKVLKSFLNQKNSRFAKPKKFININYFGGWDGAEPNFFKGNGWAVQARNAAR
jgi:sulfate transport system substrate-binding protein